MSSTSDKTPAATTEQDGKGRELRIEDLPAQGASAEQEDALRGGLTRNPGETKTATEQPAD